MQTGHSMDELALDQIEKRLRKLRRVLNEAQVSPGWIYYMRHALGLTLEKLGLRAKLSKATIQQVEKREIQGRITITTLKKLAHAMDCEFIYAFVPNNELKTFLFEKAYNKAEQIIKNADLHMTLEDQKVTERIELRIKRLAQELMARGDVW
jgi:predicted DNA-binding mobile mystery protein A